MSRLFLIRHAQASFLSPDYDQLSSLGEAQARALGDHWLRLGVEFDEVIVGPRKRHFHTAEIVKAVYQDAGRYMPDAEMHHELDEHFVDQLLEDPLDGLVQLHPALQSLADEYRKADSPDKIQRAFQRLFESLCHLWLDGAPGTESIESWDQFHIRVEATISSVVSRPSRNRNLAVYTSVGPISAALHSVLKCPPQQAFELGWRLKNCSVTELIFSGERISLDQFNNVAHLSDPRSWTFR
jgi:broad specificity phosphatase PhoE